ncbi:hypothetical protein ACP275_12G147800 [Erythranthe tilingii]
MPVPWLERLLNTTFFNLCRNHAAAARSECNMFCLDCNCDAFCFYCRSSKHKDHQVIQIRRSSYHDVVRVSEIQKVLDISGVQTYVINSARVLFLNERPHPKLGGKAPSVSHLCQICGRSLLDTFRFCSLGCKVVGKKRNNGEANAKKKEVVIERERERERRGDEEEEEEEEEEVISRQELGEDIYPNTPPPTARRRKGIPQRAPLSS